MFKKGSDSMTKRKVVIEQADPKKSLNKEHRRNDIIKVAAYCRVSTDHEEQKTSYDTQIQHYEQHITSNPNWIFSGIYADEGITGTNRYKRDSFNQMIEDCKNGKIEMVITKSISRFARNTVDTLQIIRQLKNYQVGVYFEKENINTLDESSEVILTVLSSIAQDESRSISENVKWALKRKFERGEVMLNTKRFMGYTRDEHGKLVIVEEEAVVVRRIFNSYLTGQSLIGIARELEADQVLSPDRKTKWSTSTISNMLVNEKYAGNAILQKSYTEDYLTKKRVPNRGQMPKYHVEDSHDPIIDMKTFMRVQEEVLRRKRMHGRSNKIKTKRNRRHSKYIFTDLLTCGCCGHGYRRATWTNYYEKRVVYRCGNRLKKGVRVCPGSVNIEENKLRHIIENEVSKQLGIQYNEVNDEVIIQHVEEIIVNENGELLLRYKTGLITAVKV